MVRSLEIMVRVQDLELKKIDKPTKLVSTSPTAKTMPKNNVVEVGRGPKPQKDVKSMKMREQIINLVQVSVVSLISSWKNMKK